MSKILFVTCRNIYSMCGELKLIKGRSQVLKDRFGITTDFVAYVPEARKNQPQVELGAKYADFTFFGKNPINAHRKYKEFERKVKARLESEEYSAVVISGSFPGNIAKVIKETKDVYLVYDSHGAWEELIEFNPNIKRRFRYRLFTAMEKKNLALCDGAFAVSEGLKAHLKAKHGWKNETFIVPCALSKETYSAEDAKKFRAKWRKELGVKDDEVLFIYSGGVSPWQSIDKGYEVFQKYNKAVGNGRFLIMTPHSENIDFPDAIMRSFPAETVSEVLFAGDVTLLIRDDFVTNHVAFPNKYLEYVTSDTLIVSTPYLKDIAGEIEANGLGVIIKSTDDFSAEELRGKLSDRGIDEEKHEMRRKIVESRSFEQTLKVFVERVKSKSL